MNEPHPPECCVADESESEPLSPGRIAEIGKGLAHPVRVRILEQFVECRPHFTQSIVDEFDLAQSTISEHLRILREAGLLEATKDGPRTWHCMRRAALRQFAREVLVLTREAHLIDAG